MGIGTTSVAEMKFSAIDDPVWFVICADAGAQEEIWMASLVAFPDTCQSGCGFPTTCLTGVLVCTNTLRCDGC